MHSALKTSLLLLPLSAFAPGCGDDGEGDDHGHEHDTETGSTSSDSVTETSPTTTQTSSPTTTGSDTTGSDTTGPDTTGPDTTGSDTDGTGTTGPGGEIDVTIAFAARVGAEDAACGESYENVGSADTTISFADLRFFVSNVRLVDGDGNETPVTLDQDGVWQVENVALLDFEDATGDCTEGTTAETNPIVVGTVPEGEYTGIAFDVGVPFEHNHLNSDVAPAPLNTAAMFWNWAAGYKFVRIDILNENEPPMNRWNFHLGAQGCDNGDMGPTVPPEQECSRPARPSIVLDGFDPAVDTIVLDVAAIYEGVDVSANTADTPPGCQSFLPDVNECTDLFPNLGLTWDTGACDNDCADQTVFFVE